MEDHWKHEYKTAIKTYTEASEFFQLDYTKEQVKLIKDKIKNYPVFIPLSFAHKIKKTGILGALGKQFLPHPNEFHHDIQKKGLMDPIGDHKHFKQGQIIHRYHNRVLFCPTTNCPIICRYCFRKNELDPTQDIFKAKFQETLSYLKKHTEVEEIIFSGGDPLVLDDDKWSFYLKEFTQLSHIKYIRIHSRMPIILPSRITRSFLNILEEASKKVSKLHMNIHANHPDELTSDVREIIHSLDKTNIPLLSQTVLLKGVNDDPKILQKLFTKLIELNIRPYYLHHPDHALGAMHFYLPLEEGKKIYRQLRSILPGWAIPEYILDHPEGSGKEPAYNQQ